MTEKLELLDLGVVSEDTKGTPVEPPSDSGGPEDGFHE